MGYLYDTGFAQFIPTGAVLTSGGTYSNTILSGGLVYRQRTAADAAFTIAMPVAIPSNNGIRKGCLLKSVEFLYQISTAELDAITPVELYKIAFAADGTPTATDIGITLNADALSSALRKTVAYHRIVATLNTPVWVDNDATYNLRIDLDGSATGVFRIFGGIANFTLSA